MLSLCGHPHSHSVVERERAGERDTSAMAYEYSTSSCPNRSRLNRDWEGYCKDECLKGACRCGWDDHFCGQFTPYELAQGQSYISGNPPTKTMCWIMPTQSSLQVRKTRQSIVVALSLSLSLVVHDIYPLFRSLLCLPFIPQHTHSTHAQHIYVCVFINHLL